MKRDRFEKAERVIAFAETEFFNEVRNKERITIVGLIVITIASGVGFFFFPLIHELTFLTCAFIILFSMFILLPYGANHSHAYILNYTLTQKEADEVCDELDTRFRKQTEQLADLRLKHLTEEQSNP